MKLWRFGLLLMAHWFVGCADVEHLWATAHEDRLAKLEGLCRSSGLVPGSSEFVRCVRKEDEAPEEGDQADSCGLVEVARADGTTYLKVTDRMGSPEVGVECGTMQDGQYSCVNW